MTLIPSEIEITSPAVARAIKDHAKAVDHLATAIEKLAEVGPHWGGITEQFRVSVERELAGGG